MNKTALAVFLTLCTSVVLPATAQYALSDFELSGATGVWYDSVYDNEPELFEGSFYEIPRRTVESHPFLGRGQWSEGSIAFREQTYEGIFMLYDLIYDVLIIRNSQLIPDGKEFLRVNPMHVAGFDLEGLHFEQLTEADKPPAGPGFYYIVYRGEELSVIAKTRKVKLTNSNGLIYDQETRYYLKRPEGFAPIRRKRDLYNAYPTHKTTIRRFIRQNRLKVKEEYDQDLRRLASFCEQLPPAP